MKKLLTVLLVLTIVLGMFVGRVVTQAISTSKVVTHEYRVNNINILDDNGNEYEFNGNYVVVERIENGDSTMTLYNSTDKVTINHVVEWTN